MSFGFSVGDVFVCSKLALNAYNALKDAPKEFEGLRLEVLSLNATLRALAEEANSPNSIILLASPQRQDSLRILLENCSKGLQQLSVLTDKFPSLGINEKTRFLEHVKFALQNKNGPRDKLAIHTASINIFLTSLTHSSLGRLEGLIKNALRGSFQKQQGSQTQFSNAGYTPLDKSINFTAFGTKGISTTSAVHNPTPSTDPSIWDTIAHDLEWERIHAEDVQPFKDEIVAYIRYLHNGGEPYWKRGGPRHFQSASSEDKPRPATYTPGQTSSHSRMSGPEPEPQTMPMRPVQGQAPPAYSQQVPQSRRDSYERTSSSYARRESLRRESLRRDSQGKPKPSWSRPIQQQSSSYDAPSSGTARPLSAERPPSSEIVETYQPGKDTSSPENEAINEVRKEKAARERLRERLWSKKKESEPSQLQGVNANKPEKASTPSPATFGNPSSESQQSPATAGHTLSRPSTGGVSSSFGAADPNSRHGTSVFGTPTETAYGGGYSDSAHNVVHELPTQSESHNDDYELNYASEGPPPTSTFSFGNVSSTSSAPTNPFGSSTSTPALGSLFGGPQSTSGLPQASLFGQPVVNSREVDEMAELFDHMFDVDDAVPAIAQGASIEEYADAPPYSPPPMEDRNIFPEYNSPRQPRPAPVNVGYVQQYNDQQDPYNEHSQSWNHQPRKPPNPPSNPHADKIYDPSLLKRQLEVLLSQLSTAQLTGNTRLRTHLLSPSAVNHGESPIQALVSALRSTGAIVVNCDACRTPVVDMHWHCSVCEGGDWDCCRDCRRKGVGCPGVHGLVERSAREWAGERYWTNL